MSEPFWKVTGLSDKKWTPGDIPGTCAFLYEGVPYMIVWPSTGVPIDHRDEPGPAWLCVSLDEAHVLRYIPKDADVQPLAVEIKFTPADLTN